MISHTTRSLFHAVRYLDIRGWTWGYSTISLIVLLFVSSSSYTAVAHPALIASVLAAFVSCGFALLAHAPHATTRPVRTYRAAHIISILIIILGVILLPIDTATPTIAIRRHWLLIIGGIVAMLVIGLRDTKNTSAIIAYLRGDSTHWLPFVSIAGAAICLAALAYRSPLSLQTLTSTITALIICYLYWRTRHISPSLAQEADHDTVPTDNIYAPSPLHIHTSATQSFPRLLMSLTVLLAICLLIISIIDTSSLPLFFSISTALIATMTWRWTLLMRHTSSSRILRVWIGIAWIISIVAVCIVTGYHRYSIYHHGWTWHSGARNVWFWCYIISLATLWSSAPYALWGSLFGSLIIIVFLYHGSLSLPHRIRQQHTSILHTHLQTLHMIHDNRIIPFDTDRYTGSSRDYQHNSQHIRQTLRRIESDFGTMGLTHLVDHQGYLPNLHAGALADDRNLSHTKTSSPPAQHDISPEHITRRIPSSWRSHVSHYRCMMTAHLFCTPIQKNKQQTPTLTYNQWQSYHRGGYDILTDHTTYLIDNTSTTKRNSTSQEYYGITSTIVTHSAGSPLIHSYIIDARTIVLQTAHETHWINLEQTITNLYDTTIGNTHTTMPPTRYISHQGNETLTLIIDHLELSHIIDTATGDHRIGLDLVDATVDISA